MMTKKSYDPILLFIIINVFYLLFTVFFMEVAIHSISKQPTENKISENTNAKIILNETEDKLENEFIPTITIDRTSDDTIELPIEYRYNATEKEFAEFVRVVEAEVTGENPYGLSYKDAFESKLHVAQVILNRIESKYFPNNMHDVIFQKNAFTPILDGRYWEVEISQVTIDACKYALLASTKDTTNGCEFFISRSKECKYGSYVFTDKVNHSFFKYYRND